MSALEIKIRLARDSDLGAYTRLLQKSFQDTFSDDAIGLPKSFFSEEIFSSERIQGYFSSRIRGGKGKKTWLAFHGADLIGAMTAKKVGREVEFEGFYVDAAFRGGGIGKVMEGKSDGLPRGALLLAQMSSQGNLATSAYTDKAIEFASKAPQVISGYIGNGSDPSARQE